MENNEISPEEDFFKLGSSWNKFSLETIKIFYAEAKDNLDQTVTISRMITDKAYIVIGLCITFGIGVLGYLLSILTVDNYFSVPKGINLAMAIVSFLLIIFFFSCLMRLIAVIAPRIVHSKGCEPIDLIEERLIMEDSTNEQINLLLELCQGVQERIDTNRLSNKKRNGTLFNVIKQMAFIPFICSVLILIIVLLIAIF